jgi:hypothetical protein
MEQRQLRGLSGLKVCKLVIDTSNCFLLKGEADDSLLAVCRRNVLCWCLSIPHQNWSVGIGPNR